MLKKAIVMASLTLSCICSTQTAAWAQCPPAITLSAASASITIDDFSDITAGVTRNGITNISINSACDWDLFGSATLVQNIDYTPGQNVALSLAEVDIRAFNVCETPDHDYGLGSPPPPPRISRTFDAAFTLGPPNYIIGTAAIPDGPIAKAPGPCLGTIINGPGTGAANPTTHTFRIDLRITPGIAPVIKPGMYDLTIDFSAVDDATGAFNLISFTLQIEILPVMQLKMSSNEQVEFIFSDVGNYSTGITRYGATRLSVSSSMNWDLVAVGTSTLNESTAGASPFWDQNLSYSATGSASIPITVLELHQIPGNPAGSGAGLDYSPAFTIPPSGNNYIEEGYQNALGAIVFANPDPKTVAGDWGTPAVSMPPGSYLPVPGGAPVDDHTYSFSYRITPGLPVTFNGLMGTAQPGYYTMQVRYLISIDQ